MSDPLPAPSATEWLTEVDIMRAAKLVINLRGASAAHHALRRATDLQHSRSFEAEAIWRRIVKAIEQLQAETAAPAS